MRSIKKLWILAILILPLASYSQNTQIRGFVDVSGGVQSDKTSFSIGEQDLFITSQLNDRFSFLGESVFKYASNSPTHFSVSVERVVIKYNYYGNHNFLAGKHHTPVNYWNDTYHHGRVFFPTIGRPLLFDASIIPIHTTGIRFQGLNLGTSKFGYDLMVGNGIGSSDVSNNDKSPSVTAAVQVKPIDGMRLGASWYNDHIAKGSEVFGKILGWDVRQNLLNGSVSYFGDKFEVLAEGTMGFNKTDTTGTKRTLASYIYAGYKIKKVVPYVRFDQLDFQDGEILFKNNDTTSFTWGVRYNISYLTVVKFEYQHSNSDIEKKVNKFTAQIAIGF